VFAKVFPDIRGERVSHPEAYLLAGSLERIDVKNKVRLGNLLVQQLVEQRASHISQTCWALARVASRVPLYSGPEHIVRPRTVENWTAQLLQNLDPAKPAYRPLTQYFRLAARIVNDREFDVSLAMRERLVDLLEKLG